MNCCRIRQPNHSVTKSLRLADFTVTIFTGSQPIAAFLSFSQWPCAWNLAIVLLRTLAFDRTVFLLAILVNGLRKYRKTLMNPACKSSKLLLNIVPE